MGNKIDINLCESAKAKNGVIAYLIVSSEYGMTNASISSVAFSLTATPKCVKKWGKKICIHLCKRTKVKITDIPYLGLLRVRTDRNTKGVIQSGNKINMYLCKQKAMLEPVSYSTLGFPSTE